MMTAARALRWWPPVGILAMVVLGLAVGGGSTRIDDGFIYAGSVHAGLGRLLFFTEPLLLLGMLLAAAAVALSRRGWRPAGVVLLTPLVAVIAVRVLKRLFGREMEGALAYPSGHVVVMVTVLGMVVLVAGARVGTLVVAAVFALLGMAGQAFTHHYFTDTIGAALLGTALVCVAFRAAKLDRCQPHCDLDHSGG